MTRLDEFNLFDDAVRECPFAYLQTIRQESPVYFMKELGAFYVSRYEDVRYVKKHPELFSNNIYEYGSQRGGNVRNLAEAYRSENGWKRVSTLQRTDPPVHTMYRGLINDAFSVARVRKMTDYVETCVNDLIDRFIDQGRADLVADFCHEYPISVISQFVGMSGEDVPDVASATMHLRMLGQKPFEPGMPVLEKALRFLYGHISQVLAERRAGPPQDDFLGALIDLWDGEDQLTESELIWSVSFLLLGGHDTTRYTLAGCLICLGGCRVVSI